MKLYTDNGYLNIDYVITRNQPYNFVIGGRGTGKTYGVLKYMIQHDIRFIYMRRTQTQLDNVCNRELSPIKPINLDLGLDIQPEVISKNAYAFVRYDQDPDDPEADPARTVIGYAIALSTISNLRGFSAADVEYLVYDEFIPETHEKPIRNECDAFLNAIETINRNRELQDQQPLKVISMANANDFANPIFIGLGLVTKLENLIKNHREEYIQPQRGIAIFLLQDSPISGKKQQTSLYRLTGESDYSNMAINNIFADYDSDYIKSQDLRQYTPIVTVGELTVYRHKARTNYYISTHRTGSPPAFKPTPADLKRFKTQFRFLQITLILSSVLYETHYCQALWQKYLTMA